MLSKSRIVPSSVKLTFTKNTITNEIIDNGRGFLYNKTEYESDVNV
jgi:signal transduction histidine kinase